jgi:hypothetical protein
VSEVSGPEGIDSFLTKWAKDSVENAASKMSASAEKLTTGLAFFWTVYTAIAVVGVGLSDRQFSLPSLLVVLSPIVILIFAYLAALRALVPPSMLVDTSNLYSVKSAYMMLVGRISKWVRVSSVLTTLAAICIIAAGITVALTAQAPTTQFKAAYISGSTPPSVVSGLAVSRSGESAT